jgi:hypothetical protein
MGMKRQMNMCLLKVHDIYINSIKFDINTNNDELLKTIWEHKKIKEKKIFTCSAEQSGAQVLFIDQKNQNPCLYSSNIQLTFSFSKSNAYVNEGTYFYHAKMQGDDKSINYNNILLEMLVYFNLKL